MSLQHETASEKGTDMGPSLRWGDGKGVTEGYRASGRAIPLHRFAVPLPLQGRIYEVRGLCGAVRSAGSIG